MSVVTKEKKFLSFFREVRGELKKITWTSKSELVFCTKAVIASIFLFGFLIYLVDLGISGVLKVANGLFQAIFG